MMFTTTVFYLINKIYMLLSQPIGKFHVSKARYVIGLLPQKLHSNTNTIQAITHDLKLQCHDKCTFTEQSNSVLGSGNYDSVTPLDIVSWRTLGICTTDMKCSSVKYSKDFSRFMLSTGAVVARSRCAVWRSD